MDINGPNVSSLEDVLGMTSVSRLGVPDPFADVEEAVSLRRKK